MVRIVSYRGLAILCVALFPTAAGAQTAAPHYDVIALRAEFHPDETDFTTGNGTFAGPLFADGLTPSVDPLPHDAGYFQAHLAFLEHYVRTVSDGRTQVTTHLLPEVVTVSGTMGDYSPTGQQADSDPERRKLVSLIGEAWGLASQTSAFETRQLDPGRTVFMLFHAGVGRDVELIGTILDKTPLDLPSIFFPGSELKRLGLHGLRFKEIPIRSASVLPRTESRQGRNPLSGEDFLLNLSINGLLAATFLNHLGAPDLFNTRTGESAIGRFGLMDPAGIFSFSGLFPPEPSAWTRQLLGWLDVVVPTEGLVELPAAGLEESRALRIEISDAEYFLVENRNRDPGNDGLVMQIWQHGTIVEQRIMELNNDFDAFAVDGFAGGVVVGVDDYDFSLPGRDADDRQFNGGILVWHVDERQVASGVNNDDPSHRAVDLEEADSAQEIGKDNYLGSPFDFFYEDNDSRVLLPTGTTIQLYDNRFAHNTTPDSRTNRGGHSFVVLEDFSAPGPVMTLRYSREAGTSVLQPRVVQVDRAQIDDEGSVLVVGTTYYIFEGMSGVLHVLSETGQVSIPAMSKPVPTGNGFAVMQRSDGGVTFTEYSVTDGVPQLTRTVPVPDAGGEFQPPLVSVDGAFHALFSGPGSAVVATVKEDVTIQSVDDIGEGIGLAGGDGLWVVGREGTRDLDSGTTWRYLNLEEEHIGDFVFGTDMRGSWGAIPRKGGRSVLLLRPDGSAGEFTIDYAIPEGHELSGKAALADMNGDGRLDIVLTAGESLLVMQTHRFASVMNDYPVNVGAEIAAQPLVLEMEEGMVVVLGATSGDVYAFLNAQPIEGFPLNVGARVAGTPFGAPGRLTVASRSGRVHDYSWEDVTAAPWGQRYATTTNGSFVYAAAVSGQEDDALLVGAETYNWPNPIRGGESFLRCMTSEDADVSIRIIGADGTLAGELAFSTVAGVPVEVLWNTDAASGLYYARYRAVAQDGRTETQLVKMAVIR